jgi:hypothetical protein
MSKEAITKVVQRAISDAGFRRQLSTDPTGALRGFDLSAAETAAIRAGDAGRLSALGVDQRMSKAFVLGGATVGATRTAGSDLSNASSAMASDPGSALASARGESLVSSNLAESDALISDGSSARTIIPTEPHLRNADADGAAGTRSAISDDPDGFLAAADARGDEGGASGGVSRINDDPDGFLAAADARAASEATAVRSGVHDDPDNFLAAADARGASEGTAARAASEGTAPRSVISDDPDGFLAANARADVSGSAAGTSAIEDSEGYLTSIGYDASARSAAVTDAHDRGQGGSVAAVTDTHDRGGGNVVSDSVAATSGGETAFLDDSESYLSPLGSDPGDSTSAVTDAHDRGDGIVTRIADDDDASGTSAGTEQGPNIDS